MPRVEILIVSFYKDVEWCRYNLRSIEKFARGFSGVTISVPTRDAHLFEPFRTQFGVRLHTFDEVQQKGMLHHMIQICRADEICDADFILHSDSDCHFTGPVYPEDYFMQNKPVLLRRPYTYMKDSPVFSYKGAVEQALGFEADFETMCRHPAVHYRSLYAEMRMHIERHVGMKFDDYVLAQRNEFPQTFAEFPTLGAYAHKYYADKYYWVDIIKTPPKCTKKLYPRIPPNKLESKWSHDPIDKHRAQLEQLLA